MNARTCNLQRTSTFVGGITKRFASRFNHRQKVLQKIWEDILQMQRVADYIVEDGGR